MKTILRYFLTSSLPWCILILLIVESTLGPLFKRGLTLPESPIRNPYHRFHWPQYVKHPDFHPGNSNPGGRERRIIVLGNSQAYGWLLPEERIWTHLLEERINQDLEPTEVPVRVCNWALVGGNIRHQLLLECNVQQARPDHCLVVISVSNLNPDFPQMERKLNPNTFDIAYLLYEEAARKAPARFRSNAGSLNLWIESVYRRFLPTYQYKRAPLSWLANNLPCIHLEPKNDQQGQAQQSARNSVIRIPFFTKPEFEGWFYLEDPFMGNYRLAPMKEVPGWIQKMGRTWRLDSLEPIEDFFTVISQSEIPHTIVLIPVCQGNSLVPEPDRTLLANKLKDLSEQYHIPLIDLSGALPPEDFFEPFHLNYYGHEAMADLIRKVLAERGAIPAEKA